MATTPHRNQRRQILTWGLLGPGKGIEWGIEAMVLLADLRPAPSYASRMSVAAGVAARSLGWAVVARQYHRLGVGVARTSTPVVA